MTHSTTRRPALILLTIAALVLPMGAAHATPTDSTAQRTAPMADPPPVQVGALVQTLLHAAPGPAASEGFSVARARLQAEGEVDASLAYEVEADFTDEALLKDARIAYHVAPHLTLGAGRFKVPFSYGELVSSARTDFAQRPRAARQISVGRRTGMDVAYRMAGGRVQVQGGVFSGEGPEGSATEATEEWLYAGRLTGTLRAHGVQAEVGANATLLQYDGFTRTRYGADLRLTRGSSFLTTEVLAAPDAPADAPDMGAYVTVGHAVAPAHIIRTQWDYLAASAPQPEGAAPSIVGVGYTFCPASPLRIEVDYLMPIADDAFDRSRVLINLQIDL